MKSLVSKSILIPLFAAAFILLNSSRVFGYINVAYPDTVRLSTAIGTSTSTEIFVSDGRDTIIPKQLKGTIHVYLMGSSDFSIVGDSTVQFVAYTYIQVRYSPPSGSASSATLVIVGDSNTLYVPIFGKPISHFSADLLTSYSYDSLEANKKLCAGFSVDNKNNAVISVTHIYLTDDPRPGTQWSLENLVSLPATIPRGTSTLGDLCALVSNSDSDAQALTGSLEIVYAYSGGTDSTTVTLHGQRQALNTTCLNTLGTDFGPVQEGASVTQSVSVDNVTTSVIRIDSAQIFGPDHAQFTINSAHYPITIQAGSSVSLSMTFAVPSPASKDNYAATIELFFNGISPDGIPCNTLSSKLTGSLLIPVVDSITLNAPPGIESLALTTHTTRSRHALFIRNTGGKNMTVQSLALADSTTIAFFGTPGTLVSYSYDTLKNNDVMGPIILTLETPDTGMYHLDMTLSYYEQRTQGRIVITSNPLAYEYKVVAHRLPPVPAGVSESLPQVSDFSLNPNPARGEVTISLPQDINSTVEIYDILGNLMVRKQATGQYVWSGDTPSGSVAAGVYVVRVTERDANGSLAVSSKRLIFQK